MNVLQGKSRDVVRRELMRTVAMVTITIVYIVMICQNLDVNLAVNNLLSHEDDVPDDQDGEESLPVIPSGGKIKCMKPLSLFHIMYYRIVGFFQGT